MLHLIGALSGIQKIIRVTGNVSNGGASPSGNYNVYTATIALAETVNPARTYLRHAMATEAHNDSGYIRGTAWCGKILNASQLEFRAVLTNHWGAIPYVLPFSVDLVVLDRARSIQQVTLPVGTNQVALARAVSAKAFLEINYFAFGADDATSPGYPHRWQLSGDGLYVVEAQQATQAHQLNASIPMWATVVDPY